MSKRSGGAPLTRRLEDARRLHERGDVNQALRAYGEIHREAPENAEVLHAYGVALAQTGRLADGEKHLLKALQLAPQNADVLYDVAALRDAQGRPGEALAIVQKVVQIDPKRVDAWSAIGMYHRDLGNVSDARFAYLQAYRAAPARIDLALFAAELMEPEDGAALLIECLQTHPGEESLLLPLAELLIRGNYMEQAEATLMTLRGRRPKSGILSRHLASIYLRQKRYSEAAAALYEAIQNEPNDPETWIILSNVRDVVGDSEGALAAIERALSIDPNNFLYLAIRARLQQQVARIEQAQSDLAELPAQLRATANVRMISGMLLPGITQSTEHIANLRERWMETMADVEARPTFVPEPWDNVGFTGYFLGYHGLTDRPLMEALSRATLAMSPQLDYTAANLPGGGGGNKIKVGFLSAFMGHHSVGRVLIHLMGNLDRDKFEVVLFQLANTRSRGQEEAIAAADKTIPLVNQLDASRAAIEAERLDILIFCDLHMNLFGDALAHSRMAPVQAATWGHPGTSGHSTIDYWVSCESWEPEGNERFYTEKLVRLKLPPYVSKEGPPTKPPLTRADFDLKDDARYYGCLQSPFKIHPDFDGYIAGILESDPKARILFAHGEHFRWRNQLNRRFAKIFDPARVTFLPKVSFEKYLGLIGLCDVHLDPIHFGGANTSFDILSRGKAVITLPADQMRGRATFGAYRQMGYEDLVVNSREEYIRTALRIAQDRKSQREAQNAILQTKHVLFDNLAPVTEFEGWLQEVCG